ncbi:sugar phosphate isomerase/epimerase family protein [Fusibacter ferrireducens]|uniref:Sugar phosphate isomerase/epimerase n=1 Tax=Fusibacter ferrireducens TaxID=2785058 RepID=A0ABR9ZN91_9FIRM|nr:sugar phosphate isomerase/epimerase family protein [Fusibacter ferrireducens]MBF4691943.1 sugar phosphate isomerase/epimerase [Fusibacter ferrireducens]
MQHFGMPTLIELDTLEDNVILCKSLGLDFVEINMNLPQFQLNQLTSEYLNALQDQYDIAFTFHLAEDIDIAHFNDDIRNTYLKIIEETIELMTKADIKKLNMHMSKGIHFTLPSQRLYLYEKYTETYMDHINAFLNFIRAELKSKNIQLCIENTGIYDSPFITKAVKTLLDDENIVLTWDVGHDHSSGFADQAFLEANIDRIQHFHIHDAIDKSNHLTLFDGEIDLEYFLNLSKQKEATVVFETKTIEALKESIKRLRAMAFARAPTD